MLKGLRHPHIVAALDVGLLPADADGLALPYLVLEWCEGTTLRDWLAAHPGTRTRAEAWALVRPVLDAIAYAHARGLAHRDIKPANIILEPVSGALTPEGDRLRYRQALRDRRAKAFGGDAHDDGTQLFHSQVCGPRAIGRSPNRTVD